MRRCAFYLVADSAYFTGAVAALNSLRLHGHDEPAFVLDVGLEEWQRQALARTAEVVPRPADVPPRLAKWVAPLARPADVIVVLDADVIVTRRLGPLLEQAAGGAVVAFADDHPGRFDPRWSDLLDGCVLRRRTYVNCGLVVLPSPLGLDVLARLRTVQTKLGELGQTRVHDDDRGRLFAFPDQDSWNAVFSAVVPDDAFSVWSLELAPFPRERPLLVDRATLLCRTAGGDRPFLLHQIGPKPWRSRTPPSAYTKLLPRVLLAEDVAVRLSAADLPLGLRPGPRGGVERLRRQVGLHAYRFRRDLGAALRR